MGQHCLLLQWEKADLDQMQAVRSYIQSHFITEVLEVVPTYKELALYLHFNADINVLKEELEEQLPKLNHSPEAEDSITYHIPVCYDLEHGMDLESLAASKKLSIEEVIQLHTAPTYRIHFLGFLPGFPYLSGLVPKLHQARLESPRPKIPAGSVGIAGAQTGVYPQASPGGLNLIGRTPLKLFDIKQNPPAQLKPLQKLKFYAINKEEFEEKVEEIEKFKSKRVEK
jgi:inhibitor of KinA